MIVRIKNYFKRDYIPDFETLKFLRYIGPGLLVTVGFIDPGNWASNIAAGSDYGYALLWMVTLSTIMLVILQHNVAHLGIASGLCLSEAASFHTPAWISGTTLITAMFAAVSTALAEILGAAIGLNMLFRIPVFAGTILSAIFVLIFLFTNSYKRLEKFIIGFVSVIGLSFLYELTLVKVDWNAAVNGWVVPSIPYGSMPIIMSVLGAVVMPHNLFLHSEIIQSRQWNLENEKVIKKQLDFEFMDTLFSMGVGWAINSAIIILAAAAFYTNKISVSELQQAETMLSPIAGNMASIIFAVALLFAGISSSVTAGMAGGSIFAGIFKEPYNIKDKHSRIGLAITIIAAVLIIFLIRDPFKGLIFSQMFLSIQLPITIFLQIYLTSSKKVMGKYANGKFTLTLLLIIGSIVSLLNIMLLISYL
ncbi:MAG TPA: Nramp family divalent metal transporter [Spirochaetota bacterium]|nr:Nramp family divalent metal transporter [Spirochaetota bacterium]HPS86054.1 Nramp family divalent metal transporter [Spirochaetota bacterium]